MAKGYRIATAYVDVRPDLSSFPDELKAKLAKATSGTHDVSIGLDQGKLDAGLAEAEERHTLMRDLALVLGG